MASATSSALPRRLAERPHDHCQRRRAHASTGSSRRRSRNPLKDTLGAVDEIVAMTDRVIEIRLRAPRPNLLQLLAQPEFALAPRRPGQRPVRDLSDKPAARQASP